MLGQRGRVSIYGGRTGEDYPLHTRIAGGDENVQGAIDVDLICLNRLLHRARHGRARREMNDIVGALANLCEGLAVRSEEHTSELQSHVNLVCRLLLEKKKKSICG